MFFTRGNKSIPGRTRIRNEHLVLQVSCGIVMEEKLFKISNCSLFNFVLEWRRESREVFGMEFASQTVNRMFIVLAFFYSLAPGI